MLRGVAGMAIVAGVLLRVAWVSDMEYKADERLNVAFLLSLSDRPATALAPISQHAGLASSSGFYYLLSALAPKAATPLVYGRAVAWCNAILLVLAFLLARPSRDTAAALALCAVSITLIVHSRKVWQPDLVAGWVCLGMGALARAFQLSGGWRRVMLLAAALPFVVAAHMYVGALATCAAVAVAIAIHLARARAWRDLVAWAAGFVLGGLTLLPWALAVLRGTPGAVGPSSAAARLSLASLGPILASVGALPAPLQLQRVYLEPIVPWMHAHHDGVWLRVTLVWIWTAIALGVALWALAFVRIGMKPRELRSDPLLTSAVAVVLLHVPALFIARLGSYQHYWLGAIPFAFYALTRTSLQPARRLFSGLWVAFAASLLLASLHFLVLVHRHGGLPGEYGPAFSRQAP
jgi:hypothetical protein